MIIDMIESVILLFVFCLSHVFLVSIFFFSFFKNFIYVPFLFLSYNSVFFFYFNGYFSIYQSTFKEYYTVSCVV